MLGGRRAKTGIFESSLQCRKAPLMSNDQVWTLSALPILAAWAKNAKVAVILVVASVAGAKVSPYDESGWVCPPPTRRAAIDPVEGPIGVELRLEEHLAVHDDEVGVCRLSATAFGERFIEHPFLLSGDGAQDTYVVARGHLGHLVVDCLPCLFWPLAQTFIDGDLARAGQGRTRGLRYGGSEGEGI
jgi:hypothetical protein